MANPFYVEPLGNSMPGIQQGLAGLGAVMKEKRQEDQRQQLMKRAQEVYESGDPDEIARFSMANPDIGKSMIGSIQFRDQETEKNLKDSMQQVIAGYDPAQVLQRRAELVESRGGDASDTRRELEVLQRMGPEKYRNMVQNKYAMAYGDQGIPGRGSDTPAGVREFEAKVKAAGLKPGTEEYRQAALIALGMEPRAGISASERIANDPALAQRVAALEAQTTTATEGAKQDVKAQSPEEQRKQRETAKATKMEIANANNALEQINNLTSNEEYIDSITGVSGKIPKIPGTEGFDAEVAFNQFKDTLTLENLGKMSGVLSETDIKILSSAASGLEAGMSKDAFKSRMKKIRSVLQNKSEAAKKRLKDMGLDVDAVEEGGETPQEKPFSEMTDEELRQRAFGGGQ